MSKFAFDDSALSEVNADGDLFYDMTSGGYIKAEDLLTDKELGKKVDEAAALVASFLEAMVNRAEQLMEGNEE